MSSKLTDIVQTTYFGVDNAALIVLTLLSLLMVVLPAAIAFAYGYRIPHERAEANVFPFPRPIPRRFRRGISRARPSRKAG